MKKVWIVLLSLCMAVGMCACGKNDAVDDLPAQYTRLYGFETYNEFMSVRQVDYMGKYALCDDATYVKKGKSSVKLEISGSGYGDDKPGLMIDPKQIADGREDFSGAERIVFDVYNAQEEEKNCYFSATFATSGSPQPTRELTYVLRPQAWTRCVYDLDYEKLSLVYDFSQCTALYLRFDGVALGSPRPIFYLDEFLLKETDGVRKSFDVTLDENEFCGFEKDYQAYVNYVTSWGAGGAAIAPTMSINTDAQFVREGNRSLKLHIPSGTSQGANGVFVKFADKLIEKIDWQSMDETYTLAFDVYNDSDGPLFLSGTLTGTKGADKDDLWYEVVADTAPRTWTTCKLSLQALAEKFPPKKEGDPTAIERLQSFQINYMDFIGEDKDVYIDNIRFEKEEE